MALRIVMMGTGAFALPTFRALCGSRHLPLGLFTQPDRSGRGHHRHVNPLKQLALQCGVPVFQPQSANEPEAVSQLAALSPDVCLVAAYGQILRPAVLAIPRRGTINVHASLLPKYRGAAPIQAAILSGEHETGVTIFQIEPAIDAGPVYAAERTPIGPAETAGDLEARLAEIGAALAMQVLDQIEAGTPRPLVQDSSQASRAPRLKKESGRIDWNQTAAQIERHVRAMQPWPMAHTILARRAAPAPGGSPLRLIILAVAPAAHVASDTSALAPGTIVLADQSRLVVQTRGGALEVLRLRPEGKRDMSAAEFLRGYRIAAGDRFASLGG
jgi:methionyl-tRNA formyltransferase